MNYTAHPSLIISLLLHLVAVGFGSKGCSLSFLFHGGPLVLFPFPAFQSPVHLFYSKFGI